MQLQQLWVWEGQGKQRYLGAKQQAIDQQCKTPCPGAAEGV